MNIPAGITSGAITLQAPRGRVTSTQSFEPFLYPEISGLTPTFGALGETISITGSNLTNTYVWFVSPNSGKYVSGLNQSVIGGTGISCTVPREITIGPISVSGSGSVWASSSQTFIPLPTISGFGLSTGIISGGQIRITGINSYLVNSGVLFLTGSGNFFNILSGSFTSDYFNVTGSQVIDPQTGYSVFVGTLSSITVDTGKLAIINNYYSGITGTSSFLTSAISDKLSNIISTNIFYLQETAPQLY
jgi:hypothetical protein